MKPRPPATPATQADPDHRVAADWVGAEECVACWELYRSVYTRSYRA